MPITYRRWCMKNNLFYRFYFNVAKLPSYFTYTVLHGWPLERNKQNAVQCFKQLYSKHAAQFHVFESILQNTPCFIEVLLRKCLTHSEHRACRGRDLQPLRSGKKSWKRASATPEHPPPPPPPPSRALGQVKLQEKYILTSSKSKHLRFKVQKSAFTKQHASFTLVKLLKKLCNALGP